MYESSTVLCLLINFSSIRHCNQGSIQDCSYVHGRVTCFMLIIDE